jgi:NADPH:quinone reductase-like Zn-dependent oxidoreductase
MEEKIQPKEKNIDIINELAEAGKIKPHICKEFKFEESKEALIYLQNRKLIGKVAILIP